MIITNNSIYSYPLKSMDHPEKIIFIPKQSEKLGISQEAALNLSQVVSGAEAVQLKKVEQCRQAQSQWLVTPRKTNFSDCLGIPHRSI